MRKIRWVLATALLAVILLAAEIVLVRNTAQFQPETWAVFAKTGIAQGIRVKADMVELRKIPVGLLHKQSIKTMDGIVGKYTKAEIVCGEMVLQSRLCPGDEEEIQIRNKDCRLFSVEFKGDQANGWLIRPDQYVDILFVPDERFYLQTKPEAPAESAGRIMSPDGRVSRLQNIRIAAVIDDRGRTIREHDGTSLPKYISFEVTKQQDELLAYAKSRGRLELSVIPAGIPGTVP